MTQNTLITMSLITVIRIQNTLITMTIITGISEI